MPSKKKKLRHGPMGCPADDCSDGRSERQYEITAAQREIIADDVLLGDGENWSSVSVYRCGYCGAVYLRGEWPRILGYLDNMIIGAGWHPRRSE